MIQQISFLCPKQRESRRLRVVEETLISEDNEWRSRVRSKGEGHVWAQILDSWSRRAAAVLKSFDSWSSRQLLAQGEGRVARGGDLAACLGFLMSWNRLMVLATSSHGSCNRLRHGKYTGELHCWFWRYCRFLPQSQRYPISTCCLWRQEGFLLFALSPVI